MSTSESTTVDSPDGEYTVSVQDVWISMGVEDESARTLPDSTVMMRIQEAIMYIESEAGPEATPEQKQLVARAQAAHDVLSDDKEEWVSSMDALDVSIDYDFVGKREELSSRIDRLLSIIRPDGKFVFRSI